MKKKLTYFLILTFFIFFSGCSYSKDNKYNLTVTGELDYLACDIIGKYDANEHICVRTFKIDEGIEVLVNGLKIEKNQDKESRFWYFCFEMPSEDSILRIEKENLIWTNDDVLIITIKNQYKEDFIKNLHKNLEGYNYKKAYIIDKIYYDGITYYNLLVVVNGSMDEFCDKLKKDERINTYGNSKYLPYESYDNRYLSFEKSVINVGESLTISLNGDCDIYMPPLYDELIIKPLGYSKDKNYDSMINKYIKNIMYISYRSNDIFIKLNEANFYDLVKIMDVFSKMPDIEEVGFNYLDVIMPIWEFSDSEIVSYTNNSTKSITIIGLKPGTVKIRFDGFECSITVV